MSEFVIDELLTRHYGVVRRCQIKDLKESDIPFIVGFRTGKSLDEVNGYGAYNPIGNVAYSHKYRTWVDIYYLMEHLDEKMMVPSDQARTPYVYPLARNIYVDLKA